MKKPFFSAEDFKLNAKQLTDPNFEGFALWAHKKANAKLEEYLKTLRKAYSSGDFRVWTPFIEEDDTHTALLWDVKEIDE